MSKRKEWDREYYLRNRDEILKKARDKDANRTPEQKARDAETKRHYYEKNKKRINENGSKYQKDNPDKSRESTRKWASANKGKIKKWGEMNRIKTRQYCHARRLKVRGGDLITEEFIERLILEQGNACNACRSSFEDIQMQIDHIIPLSKGGAHSACNIQLLCKSCNCSKSNKMPIDWAFYFESTRPFSQL